jgi:hypothetical protein
MTAAVTSDINSPEIDVPVGVQINISSVLNGSVSSVVQLIVSFHH